MVHGTERIIESPKLHEHVAKRAFSITGSRSISVLKVQSQIMVSASAFLRSKGFMQILPPIVAPATDPGLRGAKRAEIDYYGHKFFLTGSMLLHKQMAIRALDRIFSFSPNVRLEPLESMHTGRHLTEFTQIDVEAAHFTKKKIMEVGEGLISRVCADAGKHCRKELQFLKQKPIIIKTPFKKLTHRDAVEILKSKEFAVDYDKEIPWEAERALSLEFDAPFWICDYPDGSRGFYDRFDEKTGRLSDFDLMYPDGYGEAASGGEREHTVEGVLRQMKKTSINPAKYKWYLEMLKAGTPPSAGFGVGLERLTRWICGLAKVWEAAPFPKVPGVVSP